jgi:hypothetical protein
MGIWIENSRETAMSPEEPLMRQWNLLKAMQAVHYGLSGLLEKSIRNLCMSHPCIAPKT